MPPWNTRTQATIHSRAASASRCFSFSVGTCDFSSSSSERTFSTLALKRGPDTAPAEYDCPWRCPGQYEDAETGLYYNRHRHYDPLAGQYASPDPIGLRRGSTAGVCGQSGGLD
ncbi:RHS repeat-associated core domain-containing protein [Rhizobium halophytocola]|uniref:RHS repeat-associated core domain-containing protein n=1 Tax=Rhizobium halophytocola TaxID=735519 RepID=UPI001AE74C6B